MNPGSRQRSWVALVVVLSVGFAVLAHASIVEGVPAAVGALLSLVPLAVFAFFMVRRARRPALALALIALATVGIAWAWPMLERHFPSVFFLEHAGINLAMAFVFGRTLAAGREPLVTSFARIIHGHLPPEVVRYTHHVTVAWTVFFALLFALSCVLYLGNFLSAWSMLANILSPVLLIGMFVVEYGVRLRVLPDWERVSILDGIRAFSRHFGEARFEAPR